MTALGGHSAEHIATVWLVAAGFGATAIAALVVLYRRAAAHREFEEAERVIEDAFREDAEHPAGRSRSMGSPAPAHAPETEHR